MSDDTPTVVKPTEGAQPATPSGNISGYPSLLGCCDLHYQHSVADYIGEVLLAFGASGHYVIPSTETNIDRQLEETNNGNIGKMHR
jgi:hypothetical protein